MKESFTARKNQTPETVKLLTVDEHGTEAMAEWEVSHSDGDMINLKQEYGTGDDARFIYRGMSRARYAELSGNIDTETATDTDSHEQIGDFDLAKSKQSVADIRESAEQAKQTASDSLERIKSTQQESKATNEAEESYEDNFKPFSVLAARKLLSYADIYGDEMVKTDYMVTNKSAVTYTQELIDISAEHSQEAVLDLQEEISDDYFKAVAEIGFERSSQSVESSRSWAIWDIAKQTYLERNSEESNENYKLADPFDPKHRAEKVREISSRHIGWEFEAAMYEAADAAVAHMSEADRNSQEGADVRMNALVNYAAQYAPIEKRLKVIDLVVKAKNPMHSYEYTQLGELLRPDTGVDTKDEIIRQKRNSKKDRRKKTAD